MGRGRSGCQRSDWRRSAAGRRVDCWHRTAPYMQQPPGDKTPRTKHVAGGAPRPAGGAAQPDPRHGLPVAEEVKAWAGRVVGWGGGERTTAVADAPLPPGACRPDHPAARCGLSAPAARTHEVAGQGQSPQQRAGDGQHRRRHQAQHAQQDVGKIGPRQQRQRRQHQAAQQHGLPPEVGARQAGVAHHQHKVACGASGGRGQGGVWWVERGRWQCAGGLGKAQRTMVAHAAELHACSSPETQGSRQRTVLLLAQLRPGRHQVPDAAAADGEDEIVEQHVDGQQRGQMDVHSPAVQAAAPQLRAASRRGSGQCVWSVTGRRVAG